MSRGYVKKTSFYVPEHVPAVAGVLWVNVNVGQIYWRGAVHMSHGIQCDRQSGKPSDAIYGPVAR